MVTKTTAAVVMVLLRRIIVLLSIVFVCKVVLVLALCKGRGGAAFDKKENDLRFTMVIGKTLVPRHQL